MTDESLDLLQHVENEIRRVCWDMVGWWKAAIGDDGRTVHAKAHVVSLRTHEIRR